MKIMDGEGNTIVELTDEIDSSMETGTTLKENGLVVLDDICDISGRVIVNKSSFKFAFSNYS